MSKDFEQAYKEAAQTEAPDLWDRIEAGLKSKSVPEEKADRDIIVSEEIKTGKESASGEAKAEKKSASGETASESRQREKACQPSIFEKIFGNDCGGGLRGGYPSGNCTVKTAV